MFLPGSFLTAILLFWFVGGALLGAVLGYFSARLMRLDRRRPWLDAATGAAVVLLLFALIVVVTRGTTTVINGRTLGRRGIVLDHLIAWGLSTVCIAVVGRQLLAVRVGRRVRNGSLPPLKASSAREQ
jgi:NhaP-type Na+/H+ or K+/H+ antiporter